MTQTKNLASLVLVGAMTLAGCDKMENSNPSKNYSSMTLFITTAKEVIIEPHYGLDSMIMDGIIVTRFASGNGLNVPNIKESTVYTKGSPEYASLRPLLTVTKEY